MTDKLLLAYQEDLKNLKVETMQKENPVATIQFLTKMQAKAETKREEIQSSWKYSDVTSRGYYPIYPSFKNTLELLKECEVNVEEWNSLENVKEINFDIYQFNDYRSTYEDKGSQYLTITDEEDISQIMSVAAIDGYSNMNPFGGRGEERVTFSAVTESGGRRSETSCTIQLNQLPESVKNEISKIKEDV